MTSFARPTPVLPPPMVYGHYVGSNKVPVDPCPPIIRHVTSCPPCQKSIRRTSFIMSNSPLMHPMSAGPYWGHSVLLLLGSIAAKPPNCWLPVESKSC